MRESVPQPPIQPALRETEAHDFWPGFVLALIGVILVVCGTRHLTGIDTMDGGTAWERQLVKAFSSGGLEYSAPEPSPEPGNLEDPSVAAQVYERPAKASGKSARRTFRVNTGASTPCPT